MRIRRVTVEKLFGIFDHDIELNEAEHITILSGPNGFGKTILLRMIDSFLRGRYDIFARVPFAAFQVTFEDEHYVRLEPGERQLAFDLASVEHAAGDQRRLDRGQRWGGRWAQARRVSMQLSSERGTAYPLSIDPFPDQPGPDGWREPVMRDIPTVIPGLEWIRELLGTVSVRLIETQRLDITNEDPRARERRYDDGPTGRRPTVLRYAKDLAGRMKDLLALSAARAQEFDRTFPTRLLAQTTPTLAADDLRARLARVEDKRRHLTALGFLAPEQHPVMPLPAALDEKRDVLSVYVADAEDKLAVFDEMAAKVELITRIVNDLFLYKHMSVNPEEGFVFTAEPTGHRIAPDNLSSGEQHQLVLLYELLFQSPRGALVLLDEPEISLHAAWQERFLDDLEKMVALSGFDVLVATHSAEIIGEHWDLVVELKGPELAERSPAPEQEP